MHKEACVKGENSCAAFILTGRQFLFLLHYKLEQQK